MAGHPVRDAEADPRPGVHGCGRTDARAGDRRDELDLHPGARGPPRCAPLRSPRAARHGPRSDEPRGARGLADLLAGHGGPGRAAEGLRRGRRGGRRHRLQPGQRGGARARGGRDGFGRLLRSAGGETDRGAHLPARGGPAARRGAGGGARARPLAAALRRQPRGGGPHAAAERGGVHDRRRDAPPLPRADGRGRDLAPGRRGPDDARQALRGDAALPLAVRRRPPGAGGLDRAGAEGTGRDLHPAGRGVPGQQRALLAAPDAALGSLVRRAALPASRAPGRGRAMG